MLVCFELQLGFFKLIEQVIQRILDIALQSDISLFHLILQKQEHIKEGNLVIVKSVDDLSVLVVIDCIGRVKEIGQFILNACKL